MVELSLCDCCRSADGIHEAGPLYLCESCYSWWLGADPPDVWLLNLASALSDYCLLEAALRLFIEGRPAREQALRMHPVVVRAVSTAMLLVDEPGPERNAVMAKLLDIGRRGGACP